MTSVLVTGAAGKLGRAVVDQLVRLGYQVTTTDRPGVLGPRTDVAHVPTDLTVPGEAAELVRDRAVVVHLAAIPAPVLGGPGEVFRTNVDTTFEIAQACIEHGTERLVLASSVSALGTAWAAVPFSPSTIPIDEDHPLVPRDPYGLSKQVTEDIGQAAARQGLPTIIALRYHSIVTPDELRELVARTAADPGSGAATLWGYIELQDAARATTASVTADASGFHALHIVADDTTSHTPTSDLVTRYHPTSRLTRPLDGTCSAWDGSRASEVIGFRPRYRWRDP